MRCACVALSAAALLILPGSAAAMQVASIDTGFSPNRLSAFTTVSLGFDIRTLDGSLPSALTAIAFRYPPQLGLATSGLGLATCDPAKLGFYGPKACPPNSIMGTGSALAKFQVSPEISEETASLALVAGPSQGGYMKLLIAATGSYPVLTRIVMSALLLPGRLQFSVPLVAGIPEGPAVAVVRVHVKLGGNLTYYMRSHGRRVAYRPRGIEMPKRCPRGGFRFSATFSFLDGTQARAQRVIRCPRRR
jgi:hypothetical protein